MTPERKERIDDLVRRGALEREETSRAVFDLRAEWEKRRGQWKIASVIATGLATGATVAYKLLGKSSIAAKVGKAASAVSVVVSLTRAALRVRRFW